MEEVALLMDRIPAYACVLSVLPVTSVSSVSIEHSFALKPKFMFRDITLQVHPQREVLCSAVNEKSLSITKSCASVGVSRSLCHLGLANKVTADFEFVLDECF